MTQYTIYEVDTGVVLAKVDGEKEWAELPPGAAAIDGWGEGQHLVDPISQSFVPKTKIPITFEDGPTVKVFEELVVRGLPVGTEAEGLGLELTVINDGSLELTFDAVDRFLITLRHPAYLDTPFTVDVREP